MREIKFRAWYRGKMYRFVEHHSHPDGSSGVNCLGVDMAHMFSPGDEVELMQYTGLKDRSGKEMYEGDILQGKGVNWECCWSNTYAKFIVVTPNTYIIGRYAMLIKNLQWASERLEIIGNIYENQELVKAQ